jgi:protein gp37
MTNEAAERLRAMRPEDDWGDKFYAALEALWWALKGTDIPAQGSAPHQIMANLIEDIPHERRATVERIRERLNITDDTPYYHDREVSRIRRILDEEAAR